jgi:glycosyltransferase involved in cell wall biosynthesis
MLGHKSAELLARAVNSIRAHSPASWELVLVLNGALEPVRKQAELWLKDADFPLLVVEIEGKRPGAARNVGVKEARAPLLLFLDDDIECFQDLVAASIELFRDPKLQAAGGANLTPPASGPLERASGILMQSYFGAANMRARYKSGLQREAGEHALILCNLAVRKDSFEAKGGFAQGLVSNEENLLLQQMELEGAKLLHSPRLAVYHRRRDTWLGTAQQAAKYGAGRAQNLLVYPTSFRFLYLLPAAFLIYLLTLPLSFFCLGAIALFPAALYLLLSFWHTVWEFFSKRDAALLLLPLLYPLVHLSYGVGFFRAMFRWGFCRKKLACELN